MNTVENSADVSVLKTETGEEYDIPEGGSLGLLALGYIGVMLWREKKQAYEIHLQQILINT